MQTHQNKESRALSWKEFQDILSKISYDLQFTSSDREIRTLYRLQLLISVGCYCGLRSSDILKLKWSEILERNQLEIIEKKTGKSRLIEINERLKSLVSKAYESIKGHGTYIFEGRKSTGKPISAQQLNRVLKDCFVKYGGNSDRISSHSLRKTFGRRVYEMNNKIENALIILSHIFNHSSIAITRRYIGLQREMIESVYLEL